MKNTKEVTISIPEGYEIDKEKSTFEKIVFKKKEQSLPKTWEELEIIRGWYVEDCADITMLDPKDSRTDTGHYNRNVFVSKEQAQAAVALAQLTQLREVYRQGWVPNWADGKEKYCIVFYRNDFEKNYYTSYNRFLSFQSPEIRNEFLENFKDLIMRAKPLLG